MRRSQTHCKHPKDIVLLVIGIALLSGWPGTVTAMAQSPKPATYTVAPGFSRHDLDHRNVNLSAYRGKVVLLNFWATWCAPCLTEIPRFAEWQQKYGGRGLQVIGISMDDDEAPVHAAYKKYKLNYPVLMGDEQLGELYGGVLGLPVTFLIDRNGKIRFKHEGAANLNILGREVKALLPGH
jgi:cytochrome c biogenesis protein CcmG/thiol:disulfide interchange protein DsbE